VAALAGRAVLGQREGTRRDTAVFWAGCGAGLSLFPVLANDAFSAGLWPGDLQNFAAAWFRETAGLLRTHPALLLIAVPLGYAGELLVRRLPSMTTAAWARTAARVAGYGLAAAVAVSLAASLLWRFPSMRLREMGHPPSATTYVTEVLAVGLTSLRLVQPDLLLSTSFWGGFGWIDTVLPTVLIVALTTSVAAAIILTSLSIARRREVRQAIWIGFLGAGGTAALAAYAVSNHFLDRNLHGRYLIGVYVAAILCSWTVPMLDAERSRRPVRALLLGGVLAVHAYALPFILRRYF
jgi:hypothetical protein